MAEVTADYTGKARRNNEKDGKELEVVKNPEKFDMSTVWIIYKKALINYLGSLNGRSGVPLEYVVRALDDTQDQVDGWQTEHQRLVESTPHEGQAFAEDNGFGPSLRV
jgi:hypothetical protein